MSDQTDADELAKWQKKLASAANNRAWTLSEQTARTPDEDAEMLGAAHTSRYLWQLIGTERNFVLGDLLLGHVYGLLGQGELALNYARGAHDYFASQNSEPWEMTLAHAAMASACHAAGDSGLHRTYFDLAMKSADQIRDKVERDIVDATLAVIPKP